MRSIQEIFDTMSSELQENARKAIDDVRSLSGVLLNVSSPSALNGQIAKSGESRSEEHRCF